VTTKQNCTRSVVPRDPAMIQVRKGSNRVLTQGLHTPSSSHVTTTYTAII